MKNLREAYEYCREICDLCAIPIARVIKVGSKKFSSWGRCSYNRMYNTYEITINEVLLSDDCDDASLYNTMLHELLHTCSGCLNHGTQWKEYADRINRMFNIDIKRTSSSEEVGVTVFKDYKYAVECPCCGYRITYQRMCATVKHPEKYYCKACGKEKGTLVLVK